MTSAADSKAPERRAMIVGVAGNLFMGAAGLFAAYLSGSQAILLDGLFSMVGVVAALMGLYVARTALPEPDEEEWYHADLLGLACRTADGTPAGAIRAVHDFGAGDVLEIAELAGCAADQDLALVVQHGDACRVVAAVLQLPQPFDQYLDRILGADISHNSAHFGMAPQVGETGPRGWGGRP